MVDFDRLRVERRAGTTTGVARGGARSLVGVPSQSTNAPLGDPANCAS